MWHASVSGVLRPYLTGQLRSAALRALKGVGLNHLQWEEMGGDSRRPVLHLRRRLRIREAATIGEPRDIRHTEEAQRRLDAMRVHLADLPPDWVQDVLEEEVCYMGGV